MKAIAAKRRRFAAALGACEHPVFPADGDRFDGPLGCVVIQLQVAIRKICPRLWHPTKGVADGLGQWRFAGDFGQLRVQPVFQFIEDRLCARLP